LVDFDFFENKILTSVNATLYFVGLCPKKTPENGDRERMREKMIHWSQK